MKTLKFLSTGFMLLFIFSLSTTAVFATALPPSYNSGTFGCSSVTFTYEAFGFPVDFRVVDASNQVVSNTVIGQSLGTHTVTINLSPEQAPGTVLQLQHNFFGIWRDFGPATACAGDGDSDSKYIAPPWEYFGGEDAYAAFRFLEDNTGNPVLIFLGVDNDGAGSLLYYISEKMLERDFPCTGELIQIFASDDGLYQLWRLPDCQIQANVGPDREGKIHVIGFSDIPPGDDVYTHTLIVRSVLNHLMARVTDIL